jgi:hypothetical protein
VSGGGKTIIVILGKTEVFRESLVALDSMLHGNGMELKGEKLHCMDHTVFMKYSSDSSYNF